MIKISETEMVNEIKKLKKMIYRNVCSDCGNKLYGKPKRELGAITVSIRKCENCLEVKPIIPARDWEYSRAEKEKEELWN